jgi:hypothetical protein
MARFFDGAKVVENLRTESHLVGDGAFGEPAELTSFLRVCGAPPSASTEVGDRYEKACAAHLLRGLPIPLDHLPARLLRYSTSRTIAGQMIERVLGRRAREDFDNDLLVEDTMAELAASWDAGALSGVHLGSAAPVFATFEHSAPLPRDDARALSLALALGFWGRPRSRVELVIELSYPARAVTDTRFPTVADVGLGHLFRPAQEIAPDPATPGTCCGWTDPLGGHPPQPELVHANAEVRILDHPPRLVGRVPL